MDFCKLRSAEGPMGPYAIRLPQKAREALAARDFTLFLMSRMNWAEDGLRVVIGVMLSREGKVSDYLRLTYPESFTDMQRKTETDDQRRTALFRLRYLLRCLILMSGHYIEFRHWSYTGLEMTLEIFEECVHQAVGEKVGNRLSSSINRFSGLWKTVNFGLSSEDAVRRELQFLVDDLEEVFEVMREAFRKKEEAHDKEATDAERTADAIEALRDAQVAANREHHRALRRCEELAVARRTGEADDAYSSMAGLEGVGEAERQELAACFRYSHESFPVECNVKGSSHTLNRLAETVWGMNDETFTALSHLKEKPGFKDARSLGAKLYKLAKKYPGADHFAWKESGSMGTGTPSFAWRT